MIKKENFEEKRPAWQKKLEADYRRYGYQKAKERNGPLSYPMWQYMGKLLRKYP